MSTGQPESLPTFDVEHDDDSPSSTLVLGFSEFGLAGLTAADYLVAQLDLEQTGRVLVEGLPVITPFADGVPRHHTRLFSREDLDLTVLVGELFVPGGAAMRFSEGVLGWSEETRFEEVVILSGVPVAHGPEEHRPYYVASPDFTEARLTDTDITPMGGGFLDGVNGAMMSRGLDSPLRTCLLTTPAHARAPDADAALRLLEAFLSIYDLDVDLGPMTEFAARVAEHYEELDARMQAARKEEARSIPEDRMYM
ncbi:MAG: PAC2 family protein [Halobacteriales archaeon]|nr:PAC2 family protein [Halobacteriales archaeon]